MSAAEPIPDARITWERIVEEEPEIVQIMAELERGEAWGKTRAYERWHRYVAEHGTSPKARLSGLVGWHARNPRLRSQAAYRMTMERLWELVL